MVRWEARPVERWSRALKGELGNNCRRPGGLIENWHSERLKEVQFTLSQGKKKGDDVDDEDDDDVVRTSMSQDGLTVTLCTQEMFLCTQYI
jgi:hypothetical protein